MQTKMEVLKEQLNQAQTNKKAGHIGRTIHSYRKILEDNPRSLVARLELGSLLMKEEQEEEGISILRETVYSFSNKPSANVHLAAALVKVGKQEEAKKYFQTAVEIDPKQPLWVYYGASLQSYDPIAIEKVKIAYFPMPKCASSTLKNVLYKFETGIDSVYPHQFYNNPFFQTNFTSLDKYASYFKFAVVRDPISRFLSYYMKNIVSDKSLFKDNGDKRCLFCLDRMPEINYFIDRLEDYIYSFIDVRHHTLCQQAYLGKNLEVYDFVCRLEDLSVLKEKLSAVTNEEFHFPKLMKSSKKISDCFESLSFRSLKKLLSFYEDDYNLLSGYYSRELVIEDYRKWSTFVTL